MKIAQIVVPGGPAEPSLHDLERVVSYLTGKLVAQGHEVVLQTCSPKSVARELRPASRLSATDMLRGFGANASIDIVHLHGDLSVVAASPCKCPIVATLHSYPSPELLAARPSLPELALVSVSDEQRSSYRALPWQATVRHGLPSKLHTFQVDASNYLVYVGSVERVTPFQRAIEIAMRSRLLLRVADRLAGRQLRRIEPHLAPLIEQGACIEFVGEPSGADRTRFMGGARALLFTNEWAEPMPLAIVDALTCGTPVIAWHGGSFEELVDDGATGFIVADVDDAVRAVERLPDIHRSACRRAFDERFSAQRMAREYLSLYRRLIDDSSMAMHRYAALGGRTNVGLDGVS